MLTEHAFSRFNQRLSELESGHLLKTERPLAGPQGAKVLAGGKEQSSINLCSNNYLGLANHPEVIAAAHKALDDWGYGMASVRFICGTQQPHTHLEAALSSFLNTSDTILYSSCFDANGGLFECLFDETDAILSDSLNHASIVDGIRLSKARRYRYANSDMSELEAQLKLCGDARLRVIATDGVFSMDGTLAKLPEICALAKRYDALVMVDDSHAVGVYGLHGGGTPQHFGLQREVDLLTGTLGKALGGAAGGYVSGKSELVAYLRQASRPYLFSNALPPVIAVTSLVALELAIDPSRRQRLWANTSYFRERIAAAGFDVRNSVAPIIPVMLGDAALATKMAEWLQHEGLHVVSFSYPVVPRGLARIRTQISADHTREDLEHAVQLFCAARDHCQRQPNDTTGRLHVHGQRRT